MHDMHSIMVGMFWGGLVMALPPVALGVWIVVFLLRQQRGRRSPERAGSRVE